MATTQWPAQRGRAHLAGNPVAALEGCVAPRAWVYWPATRDRRAPPRDEAHLPAEERKRARTHGFRTRMRTRAGRLTLKRRRAKGRTLTV